MDTRDGVKEEARFGMREFYELLESMADTHHKKSHDYASNDNPSGNYHFAGMLAGMFAHSPQDAGFIGRIGEKIYRLANLEKGEKTPRNESVADTEVDIAVITALWMADRRKRRGNTFREGAWSGPPRNAVSETESYREAKSVPYQDRTKPLCEELGIGTMKLVAELRSLNDTELRFLYEALSAVMEAKRLRDVSTSTRPIA